ncbi:hypothetical protein C4552_02040 [Candidatus Parcubacteria bacterium]|nr:MAG: hypothetical protein C4552_02040 [Candidatus Parcubacteria bacterium]
MPWKLRLLGVAIFGVLDIAGILAFRLLMGDTFGWRIFVGLVIALFITHSFWILLNRRLS